MDGDFCRMCQRQVHDLSAMTRTERAAFLASCGGGRVCVRYTMPLRPAMAAAALAASAAVIVGTEAGIAQETAHPRREQPAMLAGIVLPPPVLAGEIAPPPPLDAHAKKKARPAKQRRARTKHARG